MEKKENELRAVSPAVIKRLPRYFRFLRTLVGEGRTRISSGELSELMNVTASQIRQDLNCFGGFGQQGYGYNVSYLYAKICELLGVGEGYTAVVIGAGNLGRALVRAPMFEKRGVSIVGVFDIAPDLVGQPINDLVIRHVDELEAFCAEHPVDIAVLTLSRPDVPKIAARLDALRIPGVWNLTGLELDALCPHAVVDNVHIGDSLMTLCYELRSRGEERT